MSSQTEAIPPLRESHRQSLLEVARQSIRHGLRHGEALPLVVENYATELRAVRACFVTLQMHGQLRGCIGSLEAREPLVLNVAHNAHAAAFKDPRFLPLTPAEEPLLEVHISVLTPPRPMTVESEQDLLRQLQPRVDGLILQDGWHRGTFLPAVWEDLPDPKHFLAHLKLKAGLPVDYWSPELHFLRYACEVVE